MKKILKKVISLSLCVCMMINLATAVSATDKINSEKMISKADSVNISDYMSEEDIKFMSKLESIFTEVEIKNNRLSINVSDKELIDIYGFNESEVLKIHHIIKFQNDSVIDFQNLKVQSPKLRIHVSDSKIYFTAQDVLSTLYVAASVGPAAIMFALSAACSVVPAAGTIIGALVGLIGGGTICYYVLQAVALQKGMYIGIDWNGAFPNPAIGLW